MFPVECGWFLDGCAWLAVPRCRSRLRQRRKYLAPVDAIARHVDGEEMAALWQVRLCGAAGPTRHLAERANTRRRSDRPCRRARLGRELRDGTAWRRAPRSGRSDHARSIRPAGAHDRRISRPARWQGCSLVATLPLKAVQPTPFQRDLSPTHTKRLARENRPGGCVSGPADRGARQGRTVLDTERAPPARGRESAGAEANHRADLPRRDLRPTGSWRSTPRRRTTSGTAASR